jgi:hypothetical protein
VTDLRRDGGDRLAAALQRQELPRVDPGRLGEGEMLAQPRAADPCDLRPHLLQIGGGDPSLVE